MKKLEKLNYTQWNNFVNASPQGFILPSIEQFHRRFGGELTRYYRVWNDNFFHYAKTKAKNIYKRIRYGK